MTVGCLYWDAAVWLLNKMTYYIIVLPALNNHSCVIQNTNVASVLTCLRVLLEVIFISYTVVSVVCGSHHSQHTSPLFPRLYDTVYNLKNYSLPFCQPVLLIYSVEEQTCKLSLWDKVMIGGFLRFSLRFRSTFFFTLIVLIFTPLCLLTFYRYITPVSSWLNKGGFIIITRNYLNQKKLPPSAIFNGKKRCLHP